MKRLLAFALLASTLASTGCAPAYRMQPNVAELMVASAVTAPEGQASAPAQTAAAHAGSVGACPEGSFDAK
jgi:hypothetical protein